MLVDANILLFSVDRTSPFHDDASGWMTGVLNGQTRVGFPWQTLTAFMRISTHPWAVARPFSPSEAWAHVEDWLTAGVSWIPVPTDRHAGILSSLVLSYQLRGNLITDASLAALAIEHGLTICSADTDFARFKEIRWENPIGA